MNLHSDGVDKVMNTAIRHLEDAGIPVTPYTHYARLSAWLEELEELDHPNAVECRVLLTIALLRLDRTLDLIHAA